MRDCLDCLSVGMPPGDYLNWIKWGGKMYPLRATPSLRQWILNCIRAEMQVGHYHTSIHCILFLIMDVANHLPPNLLLWLWLHSYGELKLELGVQIRLFCPMLLYQGALSEQLDKSEGSYSVFPSLAIFLIGYHGKNILSLWHSSSLALKASRTVK